ncbi:MAG: hypothetical protein ACMXYL_02440 [Candidatus Woesearchaeota archaeon]
MEEHTYSYKELSSVYPSFKKSRNSQERMLGQYNLIAQRFLEEYELQGTIRLSTGYLYDSDDTQRISAITFDDANDYNVFDEYVKSHIALSISPEHESDMKGLEGMVRKFQKKHGASGPYMPEYQTDNTHMTPPVLFRIPQEYWNDHDTYARILENEVKGLIPGASIALDYVKPIRERYSD